MLRQLHTNAPSREKHFHLHNNSKIRKHTWTRIFSLVSWDINKIVIDIGTLAAILLGGFLTRAKLSLKKHSFVQESIQHF